MNIDINTLKAGDFIQYRKTRDKDPNRIYWKRLSHPLLEQLKANPDEFTVDYVQEIATVIKQGVKGNNESWMNWQLVRADNEDQIRSLWDCNASFIREGSYYRGPGYEYMHRPCIRKGKGNKYLITQSCGLDI